MSYCGLMKNPFVANKAWVDSCKKLMPQLCRQCPILPGNYSINYSENVNNNESCPRVANKFMPTLGSGSWFPDGDYRSTLKFSLNNDPDALKIIYYFKMKTGDTKNF